MKRRTSVSIRTRSLTIAALLITTLTQSSGIAARADHPLPAAGKDASLPPDTSCPTPSGEPLRSANRVGYLPDTDSTVSQPQNVAAPAASLSAGPRDATVSNASMTADWHQEAHDAQHTSYTDEDIPMPWAMAWQWNGSCSDGSDCRPGKPDKGWSMEAPTRSHLVAGSGLLYLPMGAHGVWAFNEGDGRTAWHNHSVKSYTTAAFDPETESVFAASSDGRLYNLDSGSGLITGWFQADSGLNLAPTLAGDRVFVVSDNGTLYAVDKWSLESDWQYTGDSPGQTPAGYSESLDLLVYGTQDLYLHAVSNSDGSRRWRKKPTVHEQPIYYYTNGWPVIADQHGLVLMRLRMERSDAFNLPDGWLSYPETNAAIRAYLVDHPDRQVLFALNLADGSVAFVPAVGPGGMERPDKDHSMGPQPVVKRYPNGDEVVYTIWRNRQNCIGFFATHPQKNYDGGIGEMVLDGTTVPGLQAGDCRFVEFATQLEYPITVDEMCTLSMAGPTILYSHWLALISYRIQDRSDHLGTTRANPVAAERQYTILNRIDPASDCSRDTQIHLCPRGLDSFCDSKTYPGGGFWVFWNCTDPPYQCSGGYSDGFKPRYAIANKGTIYYELNGGTIFAVRNAGAPLARVDKSVTPNLCAGGDVVTYSLSIRGDGHQLVLTDVLSPLLGEPGSITSTSGAVNYDPGRHALTWTGSPPASALVTLRFAATITTDGPVAIRNTVQMTDTEGRLYSAEAPLIVDPVYSHLPHLMRSFSPGASP
jgi:outer membrane protein assembly factor BamB